MLCVTNVVVNLGCVLALSMMEQVVVVGEGGNGDDDGKGVVWIFSGDFSTAVSNTDRPMVLRNHI